MSLLNKGVFIHAQFWVWASILLTPVLALAGGLGFQLAGFFMGVSALLVWVTDRSSSNYLRSFWPIVLIVFLAWAWLSMLWSQYDGAILGGNASLLFGLVVSLLFVPLTFLRLTDRAKQILSRVVIVIGLVSVLMLFVDAASGFALSLTAHPADPGEDIARRLADAEMDLGRGQMSFTHLIWPISALLIISLKRGWILALSTILGLAVSAYLNNLTLVMLTLFIAGVFAVYAWRKPRLALILAFALAIATIVFAPVVGLLASAVDPSAMRELPLSWEHRLRAWSYSWDLIRHAPVFGHGFDSARVYNELTFEAPDGRDILVMSLHPHNIGLQIWLETGLIGALFFAGFLTALMKWALKTCESSAQVFAAVGLTIATTVNGAATIGVWQHWWWALIVFAASLISLLPHKH